MFQSFLAIDQVRRHCDVNRRGYRREKVWQIVGEPEADAHRGKISVSSPIARSLVGKTKGVTVEVMVPGGVTTYKSRRWRGLRAAPQKRHDGERV